MLTPPGPGAKSLNVLSGMTTRAAATVPYPRPVATVEVRGRLPGRGEPSLENRRRRVARFQITSSTPSALRASPSWLPAWVAR